ncbi:MAG: serine hydrolase [Lapillicoccus sp.]
MTPSTLSRPDRADLAAALAAVVAGAPAPIGVAVRGDDGFTWEHDAQRVVPSASTIKVSILVAVLRLVEEGRLHLDDRVALPPVGERVGGAGALSLLHSVTALPLVETLRLMVAVSDNDATNAIVDHAGLLPRPAGGGRRAGHDPVGAVFATVPMPHTRFERRLMDLQAAAEGRDNRTCAADLADLLVALRKGRLLGADLTTLAVELLRAQPPREGLPAYLADDVLVASKPGDLRGVRTEVALLERRGRWAVVAVVAVGLVRGSADRGTAVLPIFAALGELTATLL